MTVIDLDMDRWSRRADTLAGVLSKPRLMRDPNPAKKVEQVVGIGPHLDDLVLGIGGVTQVYLERGDEVYFIYVTYGDASCPEYPQLAFTKMRIEEELRAAEVLGVKRENLIFLPELYAEDHPSEGYPPSMEKGGFYPGRLNERLLFHYLVQGIRRVSPDRVYVPYGGQSGDFRRHPDHVVVEEQALFACRFAPGKYFRKHGELFERFDISKLALYEIDVPFDMPPNSEDLEVVDITPYWDRKVTALKEYSTQSTEHFIERTEQWIVERSLPSDRKFEIFQRIKYSRSGSE